MDCNRAGNAACLGKQRMSEASPSDTAEADRNSTPQGSLPPEVRELQRHLIEAHRTGKGVRKAFDDFCALAFSKPERVGLASEFLADLFENDEERLALMARVPDMIIELSEGHADMTCIVASHWAIGGELENLSRLAEAMIAVHSKLKGESATELMLALSTSLAVVKHSRAEQLLEFARPQVSEDQIETLRDAELWLSVGRILRTATTEERRMWNERLRKSRSRWTWESADEVRALRHLLDHIGVGIEGTQMFRAVVPPSWWDLAMEIIRVRQEQSKEPPVQDVTPEVVAPLITEPVPSSPRPLPPESVSMRSFLMGWVMGAGVAALVMWVIVDKTEQEDSGHLSWREERLMNYQEELVNLAEEHRRVKEGTWEQNSALLMGTTSVLPRYGNRYRMFLEWLQLDPPKDVQTQEMISRLMYERFPDPGLVDLWEKLASDGTVDQSALRRAARDALDAPGLQWSDSDRKRLEMVADG